MITFVSHVTLSVHLVYKWTGSTILLLNFNKFIERTINLLAFSKLDDNMSQRNHKEINSRQYTGIEQDQNCCLLVLERKLAE